MPRKARPNPKPQRQRTFIREWRHYAPSLNGKKLTLAQLSERLELLHGLILSEGQLSRIERGEQPYTQDLLEALADIFGTEASSFLMRDPSKPGRPHSLIDTVTTEEEQQVEAFLIGLRSRTGTDG